MKTGKQKALTEQHVSPAESAISAAVVVVFYAAFQPTTSTPGLLQLNTRSSSF
jgi:hypothetical protein